MARQTGGKTPLVESAKQGSIETANRARVDIASTNRAPSHHPAIHHEPDGNARLVPIHEELKREGLLAFVSIAPAGYLFVGDRARKEGAKRSPQEQRASELTEWVRSKVKLPPEISPNHAWRHTFITRAEAAGIPKRLSNAITGHNKIRDASDGYISPDVTLLKREIDKFPSFTIDITQ